MGESREIFGQRPVKQVPRPAAQERPRLPQPRSEGQRPADRRETK